MKHRIAGNKFSRDQKQRKALFKSLINSLLLNGQIKTTEAKAKRVRVLAEKLINTGRKGTLHTRRLVHSYLQNKQTVGILVNELGPAFVGYQGGFTRIIKLGCRKGDNAPMARLELLEKPAEKVKKPAKKAKKESNKKETTKKEVKTVEDKKETKK